VCLNDDEVESVVVQVLLHVGVAHFDVTK